MSVFKGNIENWTRLSEPDYYILFVKAWLPFNAWYVAEMPQHNKIDKLLIRELQDNNSRPKLKIISLLNGNDYESIEFKYNLAFLHENLEKRSLMHNGKLLSFKKITLTRNPTKHKNDSDKEGNKYKAEVRNKNFEALIVDKGNKTILSIKKSNYDINDLTSDINYTALKLSMQRKMRACYEAINPHKPVNLITRSRKREEGILLHKDLGIRFVNDQDSIARAVIKVLYALRCMLFHGEVDPTRNNMKIYQHAFYLLKEIVKELK